MPFTLHPIHNTPSDLTAWANILISANSTLPAHDFRSIYISALWPNPNSPETRATAESQLQALLASLPPGSWVSKAVETASDTPVGIAVWVRRAERVGADVRDGDGGDIREVGGGSYSYAAAIEDSINNNNTPAQPLIAQIDSTTAAHRASLNSRIPGKLLTLRSLAVTPAFQRRGVGSLLIREGTRYADSVGASITLDTTVDGEAVYARHGFVVDGRVEVGIVGVPGLCLVGMRRGPGEGGGGGVGLDST
ncbi:acyl-CoA N-acyltransferase [Pseudovirgaria hyperparasitica]|uniref:Acyl-CoA N-acyltransferase n=1 Tax=Pseudovirgaria hyperparasitica TaxID=470096 RepID=A0A6A6WEI3_9PEZI|nr:acyl-CoA N-acyltransferase [Pseudovirgaria hyperparasitica]KAF2760400.1 acyl-CoA N-acyltransferase [Pseudovirgaria hyperparasitica]